MKHAQACGLRDFFVEEDIQECLELGFLHGKSSAYIGAIISERGRGHLTTLDREEARSYTPNILELLQVLNLEQWVTAVFATRSYSWELMRMIEAGKHTFDFAYIDGGHTWHQAGFDFFQVDKLLRPGGWIIFDDLDWNHEMICDERGRSPLWIEQMEVEERTTPQVRKVWDLLVRTHPSYDVVREENDWGWARKRR